MVVVPLVIPVTTPDVFTVPTAGVLLLQVPPGVALLSAVVAPVQTVSVPVIGAVTEPGLTVKLLLLILKNMLPLPFTFIRHVVDELPGLGMVTLALPVFGKVPIVYGHVCPPSTDMKISTLAALTGAAFVPTTFQLTV